MGLNETDASVSISLRGVQFGGVFGILPPFKRLKENVLMGKSIMIFIDHILSENLLKLCVASDYRLSEMHVA